MKFFGVVARAISKIWSFATKMVLIAVLMAFTLFVAAVITPANVEKAVAIVRSLF